MLLRCICPTSMGRQTWNVVAFQMKNAVIKSTSVPMITGEGWWRMVSPVWAELYSRSLTMKQSNCCPWKLQLTTYFLGPIFKAKFLKILFFWVACMPSKCWLSKLDIDLWNHWRWVLEWMCRLDFVIVVFFSVRIYIYNIYYNIYI